MNFIPSLTTGAFALAGLICAAGPLVIHLLNRRRFRVVQWAAMDFLREALQRNRRMVELRDLAILALRTLAVLLFGFALAQPYLAPGSMLMWAIVFPAVLAAVLAAIIAAALWSRPMIRWFALAVSLALLAGAAFFVTTQVGRESDGAEQFDGSQPLHAILLVDNSMSMGYQSLEGNLLDRAKDRAHQYIDKLPEGSVVSVVPVCGSRLGFNAEPYPKDDAAEALDQIEVVDRSASIQGAVNAAKSAAAFGPDLARRIVLFSDQQARNWLGLTGPEQFQDMPRLQVVDVSTDERENTWIADFRIADGLADVETPTTFVVELRHAGRSRRDDVQVTLTVDGAVVASKSVTLEPNLGAREVRFEYLFSTLQVEPGKPALVPVKATISPDRLPADDERHLIAQVVAALPVVFVDQFNDEEERSSGHKVGETKSIRKLLAPVANRSDAARELVKIRHVKIDELTRDVLADARLVVIGGVQDPHGAVALLREYVQQGGQLVIAAGGNFDPLAWNTAAWLDGAGILPAPLAAVPVGTLPEQSSGHLQPYFLSYESLGSHFYFQLADTPEDKLRDLYALPFFFRYVEVNADDEVRQSLAKAETQRIISEADFVNQSADRLRALDNRVERGQQVGSDSADSQRDQQRLAQLHPSWLLWNNQAANEPSSALPEDPEERERYLAQRAQATIPRVLARFETERKSPYLVERRIGRGDVLFVASGLSSSWNTLHMTDTILIFDRMLRSMIQSTLPQRDFVPQPRITLPLPTAGRQITLALRRPGDGAPEFIDTSFINKDQRGFNIDGALTRGLYRVSAYDSDFATSDTTAALPVWEVPLTVNGEPSESELTPLTRDQFVARAGISNVSWVGPGEDISLAGIQVRAQWAWKLLVMAVLLFLLTEICLLAWPALVRRPEGV